jgi:uncharacterized protein YdaU (DUF1376 family)
MPKDSSYPAFLFYPDDFASDGKVEMMNTEEVGAYILLICKAWREEPTGTLPNSDSILARWARLTPPRWMKCKANVLAAFYFAEDSRWHQKRLEIEFEKLQNKKQKRTNGARIAAQARWKENAERIPNASESNAERIPVAMRMDAIEGNIREVKGKEESEYALSRVRENPEPEGQEIPDGLIDDPVMVCYWRQFQPEKLPAIGSQERAIASVKDLPEWQNTLDYWRDNQYRPESLGKMVDAYNERLEAKIVGKNGDIPRIGCR